ncbi:MAG: lipoyl synthase [Sulfolobales archaeon]
MTSHGSPIPEWIKVKALRLEGFDDVKYILRSLGLSTVCEEARCPNIYECWNDATATFMLLGETCTRSCRFCSVKTSNPRGWVDPSEPYKVAMAIQYLGLDYAVLTMVCRDDLADGGASHMARAVAEIKRRSPSTMVELLLCDMGGKREAIEVVVGSGAEVLGHNIETVRRLTPIVRDRRASYERSLEVLRSFKEIARIKGRKILTKSSIILGFGESFEEVLETLRDLREAEVDIVTIGQYLRPTSSPRNIPVARYVPPEVFEKLRVEAYRLGFRYVASGPLVRSSYRASEAYAKAILKSL